METTINDCIDGHLFKSLREEHGYGPNDISSLWNVDGVPVFRLVKICLAVVFYCTTISDANHFTCNNVICMIL